MFRTCLTTFTTSYTCRRLYLRYDIILEYKTPINILYADTKTINGNAEGEMILQLPQNEEIADKIVTYFKEKNLGVEEVDDYAR